VRVSLDPRELAARGIGIDDVTRAMPQREREPADGRAVWPDKAYTVRADGQLTDAAAYRPSSSPTQNGKPVRLDELGPRHRQCA